MLSIYWRCNKLYQFEYDHRLGIEIPNLKNDLQQYDKATQEQILAKWESIRGNIPDRIKLLEQEINRKQAQLNDEENFKRSCELNREISDLASTINDLWLWFRSQGEINGKAHH